eukprot:NODE_891_length_3400_cov_1.050591.p1 type:complete len:360 gc:universal NODE_891_length_3400_cov_1.050591:1827-748(-)
MIRVLVFTLINLFLVCMLYLLSTRRPTRTERILQILTVIYSLSMGLYFEFPDMFWLSTLSISLLFLPLIYIVNIRYMDLILNIKFHLKIGIVTNDFFDKKKKVELKENDADKPVLQISKIIQSNDTVAFKLSKSFKIFIVFILLSLMILLNLPYSNNPNMHFDNEVFLFLYSMSVFFGVIFLLNLRKRTDPLKKAHFFAIEIIVVGLVFLTVCIFYYLNIDEIRLLSLCHVTFQHLMHFVFYLKSYSKRIIKEDSAKYKAYLSNINDPIFFGSFKLYACNHWEESNVLFLEAFHEIDLMQQVALMKGCSSFAVALSGLELATNSKDLNEDDKALFVKSKKIKKSVSELYYLFFIKGMFD